MFGYDRFLARRNTPPFNKNIIAYINERGKEKYRKNAILKGREIIN